MAQSEVGGTPKDDFFVLKDATADSNPFYLRGGLYGIIVAATFSSDHVTLQALAADGTTYVDAVTAFAANGYATAYLTPGIYKIACDAAAAYASVAPIPVRPRL